jgi:site-specific recombinase XerD
MKSGTRPPLRSTRLLDQLRERIRYAHYSLRTEQAYVYWVRSFIHFHGLRHPRDMGGAEVEAFLSHLAASRGVSPSTHKQALCALLYLYREVLSVDLPWMQQLVRPRARVRVPVSTTMIYTHVLSSSAAGLPSPLDRLAAAPHRVAEPLALAA